jgi:hypothetical protein
VTPNGRAVSNRLVVSVVAPRRKLTNTSERIGTPHAPRDLDGHPRLSLVSCALYLSPATTEAKRIRLNQINPETGNRLKQQLVDSETGKVVERHQVAKGYEYSWAGSRLL